MCYFWVQRISSFFLTRMFLLKRKQNKKNRFHCKHKKIVPNIIKENIENKSRYWLTCHQTRASSIPYFFYFIRHSNIQLIQIEHFLNGYLLLLCMHFVLCICISRLFLCFFFFVVGSACKHTKLNIQQTNKGANHHKLLLILFKSSVICDTINWKIYCLSINRTSVEYINR